MSKSNSELSLAQYCCSFCIVEIRGLLSNQFMKDLKMLYDLKVASELQNLLTQE
jgi:hypothetical protein